MGHAVTCDALIGELSDRAGLRSTDVARAFQEAPTDFPVVVSRRLPFGIQRLGMVGLTLRGRVYLLTRSLEQPPATALLLLRHEAEHVRQQRQLGAAFYVRYAASWCAAFVFGRGLRREPKGGRQGRWLRAYRTIPFEEEARAAEQRFLDSLRAN